MRKIVNELGTQERNASPGLPVKFKKKKLVNINIIIYISISAYYINKVNDTSLFAECNLRFLFTVLAHH